MEMKKNPNSRRNVFSLRLLSSYGVMYSPFFLSPFEWVFPFFLSFPFFRFCCLCATHSPHENLISNPFNFDAQTHSPKRASNPLNIYVQTHFPKPATSQVKCFKKIIFNFKNKFHLCMPRQGVKCGVKIKGQYIIFHIKKHIGNTNLLCFTTNVGDLCLLK